MPVIIVLILLITVFVYFINRLLPFKVCPICAGVSGTWLLIVLGITAGLLPLEEFRSLVLLLMGATVAGIAYQGENKFKFSQKSIWHWKVPVIAGGLLVFWWLSLFVNWWTFVLELILVSVSAYLFFIRPEQNKFKSREDKISPAKEEIEKKLDECC